jgi:N-acylglucosamine 2-epimerase
MQTDFKRLADQYRNALFNDVIPFWLRHSRDEQCGGYLTCLDREGNVYDTDKFVWLQGREVWMFSSLYNNVEQRREWLDMAVLGAEFLKRHGRDAEGNWYFALDRQGRPLVQPYNIFSDCFATMAFAQLSKATGDPEYAQIARETFERILVRRSNPKGKYSKAVSGTRSLKNFSLPMILCNLSLEIERLLPGSQIEEILETCIHEVMSVFLDPGSGLVRENVHSDGSFSDSFDGRLLIPGHAIEAMWFIMDLAERLNDRSLMQKAVDTSLRTIEYGWDNEFGGITYFRDIHGHPPQQLDWDQKLWWVHIETLVCLLKGYARLRDERCLSWFGRVHEYTWARFPDPEYGEWFGYLNRRGEVLLPLKGGKWKGCFHVPRGLYQCWRVLEKL